MIDQQLPAALGRWFEAKGHEAVHVRDLGLQSAPDAALWTWAVANAAVIVSKDEDFVSLRSRRGGPQVLWLRIGNATNASLVRHLEAIWPVALRCLEEGESIVEA
ncbi:MAG TPA: DUF5615 family PIN-like protein [Caulobacteraceae bacterium]|nr:DUF5615 family PIN-like protein [Caulobacteraceae bacterium]